MTGWSMTRSWRWPLRMRKSFPSATAAAMADKLIADGVSPIMPVAVLERGTRSGSRAIRTLLADLGGVILREGVQSPALIVVGDVVTHSDAEEKFAILAKQASARTGVQI